MESLGEMCVFAAPEATWEELVGRYAGGLKKRVRGVLRRSGVRPRCEQVEEIVQEVYCRLLAAGGRRMQACRATGHEQVGAFLGRVAERVALDQVRQARAQKRGGDQTFETAADERAVDPRANPEERVLRRERLRLTAQHCGSLAATAEQGEARRNARILALAIGGWNRTDILRLLGGAHPDLTSHTVDALLLRLRHRLVGLPAESED